MTTDLAPGARGRLLSATEAASMLGVSRATVINWARKGYFPAIQYGSRGVYRFCEANIVEFMDHSVIRVRDSSGGC